MVQALQVRVNLAALQALRPLSHPVALAQAHHSQVAHRPSHLLAQAHSLVHPAHLRSHLRLAVHLHLALAPVAQVQNLLAHRVPVVRLSVVLLALVHVSQALQALTAWVRSYGKTEQLRLTGLLAVTLAIALARLIRLIAYGRVVQVDGLVRIILKVIGGWILRERGIKISGRILLGLRSLQNVLLPLVVVSRFNRVVVVIITRLLIRMKQVTQ